MLSLRRQRFRKKNICHVCYFLIQGISVVFLLFVNMWSLFKHIELPYIKGTGFLILIFIVNLFEAYLLVIVGYYFCQLTAEQSAGFKPETANVGRPDVNENLTFR